MLNSVAAGGPGEGALCHNARIYVAMKRIALIVTTFLIGSPPALADTIQLGDYLASMDRTEVTFSGLIKYDRYDDDFTFYDENRDAFRVTVDAGRDTRERIQVECDNPSIMASYSDYCTVSGSGTVEIRGSSIYISIEQIDQLGQQ